MHQLLQLATKVRHVFCLQVAKQLFNPLMMQLIHWFSSTNQIGSPETVVLMDTLMVNNHLVDWTNLQLISLKKDSLNPSFGHCRRVCFDTKIVLRYLTACFCLVGWRR